LFLGSVFAVCAALLVARTLRAPIAPEPGYVATLNAAEAAPTSSAVGPQPPAAAPEPALAAASATAEPANSALPSAPSASALASASSSAVAESALAPSTHAPTQQEVQAALRSTPVQMFSTSWCPVCARARQFFHANGIGFVDHDVDKDPAASAELQHRSGGRAIPLIEVDGQQLRVGFSEQDTMQAVATSVARRLGVTGLHLVPQSAPN
jgi:glutaredoxin